MEDKNLQILHFLWRWKLVSTAGLINRFYPTQKANTAYKAVRRLKRNGLIYRWQLEDSSGGVLYALTSKGFKVVERELPELRESGWKSENQRHDLLATAVHLGEWLVNLPDKTDTFTEQELRRFNLADYPSWIPQTTNHRPDGYWKVSLPEGLGTIALEVELKIKSPSWYGVIAQFYNDQPSIFRIVWMVTSLGNAKSILSRLGYEKSEAETCHTFILIDGFRRSGWDTTLYFGPESGRPLSFILGMRGSNRGQSIYPLCLLDTRKFPFATPRSSQIAKTPISAQGRDPQSTNNPPHTNSISDRTPLPPSNNSNLHTVGIRRIEA